MGERQIARSNARWGLIVLVALVPLLYLGFTKSIPFRHHYQVKAVFSSVATRLKSGSPVRIAGVNVGKVSAVQKGPGNTALVTMRFDNQARPIKTDATMKIRPRLFLEGNFFVDVVPGTPAAPEIADNGTIPLAQTAIPVQFDQVTRVLNQSGRTDLRTVVRELGKGLDKGGAQGVNAAFRDAPKGLTGLARTAAAARGLNPDDLSRFVANTAIVSKALTVRPDRLRALIRGLNTTIGTLAVKSPQINQTLDNLDAVLASVPAARRQADKVVPPVNRLAAALRPALRRAPDALRPTNTLLATLRPLLADAQLPRLARTTTPALANLNAQIPSLNGLFTEVDPVARCVRDNIVPTLDATLDDGKLSTGLPVWQELLRFPIGLAAGSASYNANGHDIRLSVGANSQTLVTTPSLGEIASLTSDGLVGARPRYTPGRQPPFRPDVECATQKAPDLSAPATPAPASTPANSTATQVTAMQSVLRSLKRQVRSEKGR